MDPEASFKKELVRRQQKDMHLKFFKDDPSRQYIHVPIFSKLSPKKQIIPCRNIDCLKPTCVYDILDLTEKFASSNMSSLHGFLCYSCNAFIELKKFCLDYSLKKMVDLIWEKFNKPEKIICNAVTIMRDGHWEPNLPEYLIDLLIEYLNQNQSKRKDPNSSELKVKGADEAQLTTMSEYANLPKFSEYDVEDLKELFKAFAALKLPDGEVYLSLNGVPINVEDVNKLDQDDSISFRVVALFANYLNKLQKIERDKYNKTNGNRCYVIAVNVVNYDKYYKKVKYELFFGFQNEYRKNPNRIYDDYDKVIFILKYDDRWMAAAIDLRSSTYYIADFLADDLSRVKFDETLEVVKYIAQAEFKLKYEAQEFYDFKKLNYYCDCGIYTLNYVYKCINNADLGSIKTKFNEKELFKKQLIWLILKLKNAKKIQTHIYEFLPTKEDEKKRLREKENEKEKEKQKQKEMQDNFEDSLEQSMVNLLSRNSNVATPVNQSRGKDLLGITDLFNFPKDESFVSAKKGLSRLEDNSFPSISPNKGGSKTPILPGSLSEIRFNAKGSSIVDNNNAPSLNKVNTVAKLMTQDSSMIELKRDQLEDILTNFKKEVEDAVMKKKGIDRRHRAESREDSYSDVRSESDRESSKNDSRNTSRRSTNKSHESSRRQTSLPPINQNGYYPPPYNGMQYMGPYSAGMGSPYGPGMGSPYAPPYSRNLSQSDMSRSRNSSVDSSNISANSSLFSPPVKKGKKKEYDTPDDDPDLFNYSRDEKDKKKEKKSKHARRKLNAIEEEEEDD